MKSKQILVPGLTVASAVRLLRTRELPIRGRALVSVGDEVSASDEVLRAEMPGDLLVVPVAERFGISPSEAMGTIVVREGDRVASRQLVAEHRGLFGLMSSSCEAPETDAEGGVVEFIAPATGHIGIRLAAKTRSVSAYISGRVTEVLDGRRVTIETNASLIQGIFGVGGERTGEIHLLAVEPGESPQLKHLAPDLRGKIVVGGTCPSGAVLRAAAERGAVGFVCGGIQSEALSDYLGFEIGIAITGDEPISMSVIITEGFGRLALSKRVLTVLSRHDGKSASLSGATQVRAGAIRPEIIVSGVSGDSDADEAGAGLSLGVSVRIIRAPYFGAFAVITELPRDPAPLPSGATVRVLKARLETGNEVWIARANVELV